VWVRVYPPVEPSIQGSSPGGIRDTNVPSPSEPPWFADLEVREGELQYCTVFSAAGERWLAGEQALRFLEQIGRLSYELLPGAAPPRHTASGITGRPGGTEPLTSPDVSMPGRLTPPQRAETTRGPIGPAPPLGVWRPVRTSWGDMALRNPQALSRDQRRVLALIDGQRAFADLSRILGFSAGALEEILRNLQARNLIQ
jgi:hypothetical protein